MDRKQRISALVLCIVTLLVLLLSSAYIVHEAGHACEGEGCRICRAVAGMEAVVRSLVLLFVCRASVCVFSGDLPSSFAADAGVFHAAVTPVSRKIRMND